MRKNLPIAIILICSVLAFTGGALYAVVSASNARSDLDNIAQDNRALTCAMSRLISFVPALQFEGEPRKNFIGWVESRRDILKVARDQGQCSPETVKLLEDRVRLDDAILKEG